MVLFASALNLEHIQLLLMNLNSLQYNLTSPNPTSISVAIPSAFQSPYPTAPSPAPPPCPLTSTTPVCRGCPTTYQTQTSCSPPDATCAYAASPASSPIPGPPEVAYRSPIPATPFVSPFSFFSVANYTSGTVPATAPSPLTSGTTSPTSGLFFACPASSTPPCPAAPHIQHLRAGTCHPHPTIFSNHLPDSIRDTTQHRCHQYP